MQSLSARFLTAALLLLAAAPAGAQTVLLDEGTFRLFVDGQEVGTETFSIRQSGSGEHALTVAQGRIVIDTVGGEELTTSLEVQGQVLRPSGYQVNVRGAEPQRMAGRMLGGRFSARIASPAGEMMREYIASEGAVLVDEVVAHHYYFLPRRGEVTEFQVPLLIPRQSRQVSARVTLIGTEPLRMGDVTVEARHFRIEPAGSTTRDVWLDDQGRVLRLEIAERSYRAERLAAPN